MLVIFFMLIPLFECDYVHHCWVIRGLCSGFSGSQSPMAMLFVLLSLISLFIVPSYIWSEKQPVAVRALFHHSLSFMPCPVSF